MRSSRDKPWVRASLAVFVVLSTTVALATPTLRVGPSPVSTTVYPEQEILIAFDHAAHLDRSGVECATCHELAATSRSPSDNLLPQEADCVPCHGESTRIKGRGSNRAEDRCRTCHPGEDQRITSSRVPPARLRFAHADHHEESCDRCHTRVATRALATADDLPTMPLCLSCHDGQRASRRCETCHPTTPDGRIRTNFDGERLRPANWMYGAEHGPSWSHSHAAIATERTAFCYSCHQQHECLACHDGSIRPRDVHPGDWVSAHAIEARGGELRCQSCHRGQSFCRTCHLRAGVSWRSPLERRDGTDNVVHPSADWTSGASPRHGREARRNLQSCVACHAGQDCVSCHVAINPHGPGWERRCAGLVRANSSSCTACHGPVVPDCQ